MSYSVNQLKSELTGIFHGTSLDQVQGLDAVIERAARQLLIDLDPQETKRTIPLASQVFTNVWDYPCPPDLKGNRIIDIKPQVHRCSQNVTPQYFNADFDRLKQNGFHRQMSTLDYNSMIRTLRLNLPQLPPGEQLGDFNELTNWGVTDDAGNLSIDNINYVKHGSSIKFDLSGATGNGTVLYNIISPIDLSKYLNQSSFFVWVYLPTASNFNGIGLGWGSSQSDVYIQIVTSTQQNTAFVNGWNLLQFNWLGATTQGNPDPTKISGIGLFFNYANAQTAVRVGSISCQLGAIYNIEYYSDCVFRDAITGAFQSLITDDSNLINLGTEAVNLMLNKTVVFAAQQIQGFNATLSDLPFYEGEYEKGLALYKSMYKSEVMKPRTNYYTVQKPMQHLVPPFNFRS